VLDSVRKAEDIIHTQRTDKEYLPITGLSEFLSLASKLAYGADSKPLKENRVSTAGAKRRHTPAGIRCRR
jgi:aspartate aminotransferase